MIQLHQINRETYQKTIGARQRRLCFSSSSLLPQEIDWRAAAPTLFLFVIAATCTWLYQDLTPSLVPSQHPYMQPHFTPTSSPPTPLHPIAISVLAINNMSRARRWALSQQPLRIERHTTFTQTTPLTPAHTQHPTPKRLGKVYKRDLVVTPFSPYQRVFVCGTCASTTQVGVSLVSLFDPLFKQSRLHCLDVCLT